MLCLFADQFPVFVANFLQYGRQLRRRFREESVTDLMMGNLLAMGGKSVIVEFPDETATGADMEWNFANPDDGTFFRILIQAKQLYGDGQIWTRHCYKELFYRSGSGNKLQAEILCDTARSQGTDTYPLYVFYNPARTCKLAHGAGNNGLLGANLADGFLVEALAKAANTRLLRTRNKSLKTIYPFLFFLSDLFCPSTVLPMPIMARGPGGIPIHLLISRAGLGIPQPPRPKDIRQRLVDRRFGLVSSVEVSAQHLAKLPEVPAVADSIPDDVRTIINRAREGFDDRKSRPLKHWRITFISANPKEDVGAQPD